MDNKDNLITRHLQQPISARLFSGKSIIITGPRQVGKTTLVKQIVEQQSHSTQWLSGDEPDVRERLSDITTPQLSSLIGGTKIVVVDEAQRIHNIGLTLKLMADNFPETQVIVTGSSAISLNDAIKEPLTGRVWEYKLYPISFGEMVKHTDLFTEHRLLEERLVFGAYPEIITRPGDKIELLNSLSSSYLYRDLLTLDMIKKHSLLEKLVMALALQIGQEVSWNELGQLIGANSVTVERYVDLLEKSFVVFRLPSLTRNMRNEIKKGKKIYFYDNGIRNAVINNFNPLALRNDKGALFESYLIAERMKRNSYYRHYSHNTFWRTHAQQEIDYIEEYGGTLHAYEFTFNPKKKKRIPKSFLAAYPGSKTAIITSTNTDQFLL